MSAETAELHGAISSACYRAEGRERGSYEADTFLEELESEGFIVVPKPSGEPPESLGEMPVPHAPETQQLHAAILDLDERVGWLEEHLARQALDITQRVRSVQENNAED